MSAKAISSAFLADQAIGIYVPVDWSVMYSSEVSQPLPEYGKAGMLQQCSASWECDCLLSGKQALLFQLLTKDLITSSHDIQIQTRTAKKY